MLEERTQLVVVLGELVEVDEIARTQMRFEPPEHGRGTRVERAVDVDEELIVRGQLERRQRLVEPPDLERDTRVGDRRR